MEPKQTETRSYPTALVISIQVLASAWMIYLLVNNQDLAAKILSLSAISIFGIFMIHFVFSNLRISVRHANKKRLHASLFVFGFSYERKDKHEQNTFWQPSKPDQKVFRHGILLFAEYHVNRWCFKKNTEKARIISKSSSSLFAPYEVYGAKRLNYEVYNALRLSCKVNSKFELKDDEKLPLLAAYVFVELSKGISVRQINMDKILFLYHNNYPAEVGLQLKDIDIDTLKAFDGIPPTWVIQALFGEVDA
jgi:hypothetical protein